MKIFLLILNFLVLSSLITLSGFSQACIQPDNGSGTITLPPEGCDYLPPNEPYLIIDGLPPGTTMELYGPITDYSCCLDGCTMCTMPLLPGECEGPGGSLGGDGHCFEATLNVELNGTGELTGFSRNLFIPLFCEVHTGPRNPGDPVQEFPADMFRLQGELLGDPDFCTLRITGGTDFGLPGPGQTTLTQLPTGDFNVDSFFDITYQIEFEGCPGSVIEGFAGITTATIRIKTGEPVDQGDPIFVGDDLYTSPCGTMGFGEGMDYPAIPSDFFGPGSDPFDGIIALQGGSSGGSQSPETDVLVSRLTELAPVTPPSTETVDIEIVALNLKSTTPIAVSWATGGPDSFFDVFVEIDFENPSTGTSDITQADEFGGEFTYDTKLYPTFTFVDQLTGDEFIFSPGVDGLGPINYTSAYANLWTRSPILGDFDVVSDERVILQSVAGTSLELLPLPKRFDSFVVAIDQDGLVEYSEGTGWNNSTWFVYPNFDWTNVWFYDHPMDQNRRKIISGNMVVEPRDSEQLSYVEIVWNYSTPEWPGWPEIAQPPLPEDFINNPDLEDQMIVRTDPLYSNELIISEPFFIEVPYEIMDFNPEWLSIDIRGYNYQLSGNFEHTCWIEGSCEPSGELEFGDAPEGVLAYPSSGVTGSFPTCMNVAAAGYISHAYVGSYFGPTLDWEIEGNAGLCPTFNPNLYNQDECMFDGDAGLIVPDGFTIVSNAGVEYVTPCTGANGNALGTICDFAFWGADIDIEVHNNRPDQMPVYFNLLIDWNQDGKWMGASSCDIINPNDNVPEHCLVDFLIPAGYDGSISNLLAGTGFQIGPNSGYVWARFSITERQVDDQWTGEGDFDDGETEDYLLLIGDDQGEEIDWGDAPDDPYPTLLATFGANHIIDVDVFMGDFIDGEADGQPTADALGDDNNPTAGPDDEDGVDFLWPISAGNPCKVKVKASVNDAYLNAWVDFNGDGDWDDLGDQIFNDELLIAGDNFLNFLVPKGAVPGATFARFRYSHQMGISYRGQAYDGEVEDYKVEIDEYGNIKWRQIPDPNLPGLHATYTNVVADDWLCNGGAVTDIHWWGNYENNYSGSGIDHFHLSLHNDNGECLPVNPEFMGFDVPFSAIQEMNTGIINSDGSAIYYYEFFLPEPFYQEEGQRYWLDITAFIEDPDVQWRWQEAGRWFDPILCGAVDKNDAGEWQTIFWPQPEPGRFSDMAFIITSDYTLELDFGDAPDDPYPTLLAGNGARHIVDPTIFMGNLIDTEPDGIPTNTALGDDNTNLNDEDGVTFVEPFVVGEVAKVKIVVSVDGFMNAWLDYNKDGSWGFAEHIIPNMPVTAGLNTFSFNIPAGTNPGRTFARFRYNTTGGLSATGQAQDGEVEDYRLTIFPPNSGFTPTGRSHLILVPVNILLNCVPLVAGDFVSVWYTDETSTLSCGGATYWDGTSNQIVFAFGDDQTTPIIKEGFDQNEDFLWKVYYSGSATEQVVEVGYDLTMPDFDGKFHDNGLSALTWMTDPIDVTATAVPMTICEGDSVQLDALVSGGCGVISYAWTSDPPGFIANIKNPVDNPTETTIYYVTADDGYSSDTDDVTVTVIQIPDITCPEDMEVCLNGAPFELTGATPTGGTYSGDGVSGGYFYPATAGVGPHTITYCVADPLYPNCIGCCDFEITVNPLPNMDCPPTQYACDGDPKVILPPAYPLGGEYSGPGVSFDGTSYWFDPSIGPGSYTIEYCYEIVATGCSDCCEFEYVVHALPTVDCGEDITVCITVDPFDLTQATPTGGDYTGDGVTANKFDPQAAGAGTHTIIYTYEDPITHCVNTCTFTIEVIEVVADCPEDMEVCLNDPQFELTGATPTGGTYSGDGVSGGYFYPATAGVGPHTITYCVADPLYPNCMGCCDFEITVNPLPNMDCPPTQYACDGDPKVTLPPAYPLGGEYSGPGVTFDGTDYWFDPSIGSGSYTIEYCYEKVATGCSDCCEFEYVVHALPTVDCGEDITVCITVDPFDLTQATPTGGDYTGDGVTANKFDPQAAGAGTHTIIYTYEDPITHCVNTCTFTIEVIEVVADCPEDMEVCLNDPQFELTGATPTGGTYSGDGVSGGYFYPATAGVGPHTITYCVADPLYPNCMGCCDFEITVNPLPNMDCPASFEVCFNSAPVELTAYPEGGNFTGFGVFFDNGIWYFNPNAGLGPHTIEYCYTIPNTGCTDCCEFIITVESDQLIEIHPGWQGISSYIVPVDPDIVNMTYAIKDELIILIEYPDLFYYPASSTNTIVNWDAYKGYILKSSGDTDLPMCGNEVFPKIVPLHIGWQVIPMLSPYQVSVETLFANVGGLVIVKDVAGGNVYWKNFNINTIGNLMPGVSYYVLMADQGVIEFPWEMDNIDSGKPIVTNPVISPWNEVVSTPSSHTVAFNLATSVFEPGDIVGGFTSSGVCAGLVEVTETDQPFAVGLNANDTYTAETEGYEVDEYISYKVYRPSTGETFELEATYNPNMNQGFFEFNGMSEVTMVKMSATGFGEQALKNIRIFPNPSHGIFNIEGIGENVDVTIYNAFGEQILSNEMNLPRKLDLSTQPNGVYFIRIFAKDGVHFEKLVIN